MAVYSPGMRALLKVDTAAVAHWSSAWVTQIGTAQLGPRQSQCGKEEGKNKNWLDSLVGGQDTWGLTGYSAGPWSGFQFTAAIEGGDGV